MADLTQFEQDIAVPLQINGKQSNRGWWNLVVSIRDLKLWAKGIKAHRNWKVTAVKEYFGLTGNNRQKLVEQLEAIKVKYEAGEYHEKLQSNEA